MLLGDLLNDVRTYYMGSGNKENVLLTKLLLENNYADK